MKKHLFDRVLELSKEVNLEEEAQSALVYLDAIQCGESVDDMYGTLAEFLLNLRRRLWLKGNRDKWEMWKEDKKVLDEFFKVLHGILEPVIDEEGPYQELAAALYLKVSRYGLYGIGYYEISRQIIKKMSNRLDGGVRK